MRIFLFLYLFFCIHAHSIGQTPALEWSQQFGVGVPESGVNILQEPGGGYFTITSFQGTTTINGQMFIQTGTTSGLGEVDYVISKFDASQNLIWQKHLYIIGQGGVKRLWGKIDGGGNLYLFVGNFQNGNIIYIDGQDIITNGQYGTSIVGLKLNPSGIQQWVQTFISGNVNSFANTFHVSSSGEIFIYIRASTTYNPLIIDGTDYQSSISVSPGNMIFLSFNSSGTYLWHEILPYGELSIPGVCVNSNITKCAIKGSLASNFMINSSLSLPATNVPGSWVGMASVNFTFSVDWANRIESASSNRITFVDIDLSNNLFVLGDGASSLDFGNGVVLNSSTPQNYIAKYNSSGSIIYARKIFDEGWITSYSKDNDGNFYITGYYNTLNTFNNGQTFNPNGTYDGFIAKIDPQNGNCLWVLPITGLGNSYLKGSCVSSNNEIYVSGSFDASASFVGNTYTAAGSEDAFFAKLSGCAMPTANLTASGSTALCNGQSVDISTSSQSGATYTWLNGGVPIVGQTSNTLTVSQAGNYSVIVSLGGACVDTSNVVNIQQANTNFTIGTNPANITGVCPGGNNVTLFTSPPFSNYTWSTGQATPQIQVNQSGVYQVTITNSIGCTESSSFTLQAFQPPATPTIIADNNCMLACSAFGQPYYIWKRYGVIVGGNSQYLDANLYGDGFYTVQIIDSNGCTSISSLFSVGCVTSTEKISPKEEIGIFPNPAFENITFYNHTTENVLFKIINNLGEILYMGNIKAQSQTDLNIGDFSSGLYHLLITGENTKKYYTYSFLITQQ